MSEQIKLHTDRWWALTRGPRNLPVLFVTREQALMNCEPDEYVVRVEVREVVRKKARKAHE